MGQTSARRTSVRRASAKRTSVGRSFAGRTFAWRTSALRTSAGRTSAGRTSAGRTSGANLEGASLHEANLDGANLDGADLRAADLSQASLRKANLGGAKLRGADLSGANLEGASLHEANLTEANLIGAVLSWANLIGAVLIGANLSEAALVQTDLIGADLTGCRIYGISAWNVKLNDRTKQQVLIITPHWEPEVTVDDLEVAQFVYLLLHNDKIRRVIDTVGKKGVLLLGRFTEGRIEVLERLREELRQRGYLPIVFNFDKPKTKTLTETIRVLAGLSRFVIADVTDPHSVPAELQAVVPTVMVPFLPIIEKGKKPFALLEDLRIEHGDRVFKPFSYPSLDALAAALEVKIIKPAETRFAKLQARKRRR
jgi:Pentapeptide repeats (8 copies)